MTKKFIVAIPDEPYKNSLTQNKSVEITYTGPNFLVITYDPENNRVHAADGYFVSEEEIDLSTFADDKFNFAVINAENHLLECSLITNFYTHDNLDNYEEILPTGEKFEYSYSINGALDDLFNRWSLKYYPDTNTFSTLEYQEFPTIREKFLESVYQHILLMTAEKEKAAEAGESEETLARYDEIISWCENFESTYGNIDHWKIPFPTII